MIALFLICYALLFFVLGFVYATRCGLGAIDQIFRARR